MPGTRKEIMESKYSLSSMGKTVVVRRDAPLQPHLFCSQLITFPFISPRVKVALNY